MTDQASAIGTLNESDLHRDLKHLYGQELSRAGHCVDYEVPCEGYLIDLVANGRLIEFQTGSFAQLKTKLRRLVKAHSVTLVVPVAEETRLIGYRGDKETRRRSPLRGSPHDVLDALVSFPDLLALPQFSLELVMTVEETERYWNPRLRRRRGGWQVMARRLVETRDRLRFCGAESLWQLCSAVPADDFDTQTLATAMNAPRSTGQKLAYCLRALDAIELVGKRGNAMRYRVRRS
ncbi:MAG: hypothetical protein AAF648_16280 [Pseudomonadota bacterium]